MCKDYLRTLLNIKENAQLPERLYVDIHMYTQLQTYISLWENTMSLNHHFIFQAVIRRTLKWGKELVKHQFLSAASNLFKLLAGSEPPEPQ